MLIAGYTLTVLNYLCYCTSRFMKDKKTILLLDLIAKALTVASFFCLGSLSGAYSMAVNFIYLIVANIKERKEFAKPVSIGLYLVFMISYFVILFTTFDGISSILIIACGVIMLTANWWLSPQGIRAVGFFNCFLYLSYQMTLKNWAGLIEIIVIICNAVSFMKYRHKEKEMEA